MVKTAVLLLLMAAGPQEVGKVVVAHGVWVDATHGNSRLGASSSVYEDSHIRRGEPRGSRDAIKLRIGTRAYRFDCGVRDGCPDPLPVNLPPRGLLLFPDPVTGRRLPDYELPGRIFRAGDRADPTAAPVEAVLLQDGNGVDIRGAGSIQPGESLLFCPVDREGNAPCPQPRDANALLCSTAPSGRCGFKLPAGLYFAHVYTVTLQYGETQYNHTERSALILVADEAEASKLGKAYDRFAESLSAAKVPAPARVNLLRAYLYEARYGVAR
jgi:hypothetical protein